MSFKRDGAISWNSEILKYDHFIYPSSNISSTESDVNIHIGKAWTSIGKLSIIKKSDLSKKYKTGYLPNCDCACTTQRMHHLEANETLGEKPRLLPQKNATSLFEQILEAAPHKTEAVRSPAPSSSHKPS